MNNGYCVLVYGILDAFLLRSAEYIICGMFRLTNLYDIVQNTDERIAILNHVTLSEFFLHINWHGKTTYSLRAWNLCHLYLIILTVVRVIRKEFCFSPEMFDPEESALCSETPDKDALILGQWRYIILVL